MTTSPGDVKSIFGKALEIESPTARSAFLDAACCDPALRAQVDELLAALDHAGEFMQHSPVDREAFSPTALMSPVTEGPGAVIGPYKLREQLGEGGFGVVYVAEQEQPVRRKVALKIIKPGMDTRDVIARFEAERQALALMDHPNVARVLDAGATASGRPYFVMELVHGVPITEFCDRNNLPARQRLELFVPVCRAVQHAHQKGIIHRDLKPSNILVTLHDGRPVPKVIDFGVSKALSQQLTEKTIYTSYGQMIGTPVYMSPEQAEMSGLGIDTRSDVYSLGVLLYELLTGQTPLDAQRLRSSGYAEMLRIIREEEAPRPSLKVSTLGEQATIIAQHRRTDPARLAQSLRGELDWIVMKALDKDRNRRYETANSFAADIEHYLNEEPVEACPPSAAYRFRKFARRNRRLIATAAALLAVLLIGTVVSVWQAVRAMNARRAAVDARNAESIQRQSAETSLDRARAAEELAAQRLAEAQSQRRLADEQRIIAQAVSSFYRDMMGSEEIAARPRSERGLEPSLDFPVLLDRAAAGLEQRFAHEPLSEAAVRLNISDAYRMLRNYDAARQHIERAIQLRTDALGADHPGTLEGRWHLAGLYHDEGKYDLAEPLLLELLERYTARVGAGHPNTLTCLNSLALLYHDQGKHDQAEPLYRQALEQAGRLNAEDKLVLVLKGNLAGLYRNQQKYDEAQPLYEDVFRSRLTRLGPEHHETRQTAEDLAFVYRSQGQQEQAEALVRNLLTRKRSGPFVGPINAASADRSTVILIVPTNEENAEVQQSIHAHVQWIKDRLMPNRPILTDQEALETDLSSNSLLVYGTPGGNLWLKTHVPELPSLIDTWSGLALREGEDAAELRFISAWPNPLNRERGMVLYTCLRAENITRDNGINSVFHGPSDYVIARGRQTLRSGNYVKRGSRWTLPTASAGASPAAPEKLDRVGRWQADLEALVNCLKHKHWNAFFRISPGRFDQAVAELRQRIAKLADHEILIEFHRLTALLGDNHTTVHPGGQHGFRSYGVSFVWAGDGLFVDAVVPPHQSLLRGKVVAIGKLSLDEALERVSTLNGKENDSAAKQQALRWLDCPEALAALGIVDDMERTLLTILDESGQERQVQLAPLPAGSGPARVHAFDASADDVLVSRRWPRDRYGAEWLADFDTLYCWYDQCRDVPERPVADWCRDVLQEIDRRGAQRVVFDLRRNGGGNSNLLRPLIDGLRERETINRQGGPFVLIGRGTFSSAMLNAWQLRRETSALLVGLPTGGCPNSPGEVRSEVLPHCGWHVQYSTKWFELSDTQMQIRLGSFRFRIPTGQGGLNRDAATAVMPDLEIDWSSADYFSGRDPVLQAALDYPR